MWVYVERDIFNNAQKLVQILHVYKEYGKININNIIQTEQVAVVMCLRRQIYRQTCKSH